MKELNWISSSSSLIKLDRIKNLTKCINVSEFNWPQPISRSIIPTGRAYCSTLDFRSDEPFLGNVTNSRRVVRFLTGAKIFSSRNKEEFGEKFSLEASNWDVRW